MSEKFKINEIFYSIQGEGLQFGIPTVFVRFAQCNLKCKMSNNGFDCDTEFDSYREFSAQELIQEINKYKCEWICLTGGEPTLQVNQNLIDELKSVGKKISIQTNGTIKLPNKIDWICVSPKTAEHTLNQPFANEIKYIRRDGMGIPIPKTISENKLISIPFQADGSVSQKDIDWCIRLVKENPEWRLCVQAHKFLSIR